MKQLKAFVHRNRCADVLRGLEVAGFERISLLDVKGTLHALSARELSYSVDFGGPIVSEMQIELFCEDGDVARALEIFRREGGTGRAEAGWVYVSGIEQAVVIGGEGG